MAVGDVLGSGSAALLAYQRALATVGHNIANANTDGYSRQRVEFGTQTPDFTGAGYIGTGVKMESVRRVFDQFLSDQVRSGTSSFSQLDKYHSLASQIDNLLADPKGGLPSSLQGFFNAVQSVANDPSSIAARQTLISQAETLATRFHYINQRFDDLRGNVNVDIKNQVDEINSIASSIAKLNQDIANAQGDAGKQPPNDLMDRRDMLITKLAEKVAVTTREEQNGSIDVFVGNGQALVVGSDSFKMSAVANYYDPTRYEVAMGTGSSATIISNQITGGVLGGMMDFRAQVLDQGQNMLGLAAMGLADIFNAQHKLGMDLGGNMGGDFFAVPSPMAYPSINNPTQNNIAVTVADTGKLTASDYLLRYDGSVWSLVNQDTSQTVAMTGTGTNADPFVVDGLSISVQGVGVTPGSTYSFLVRPTTGGAGGFDALIKDTTKIAAASPVRTTAVLANTGNGTVDAGAITDPALYTGGTYTVTLGASTPAAANGATRGVITDAGANNNLRYELWINGRLAYTQNEAAAPLSNLTALASAINTNVSTTGVRAYVDTVANKLYLASEPQSSVPITVNEKLVDTGAAPLDAADTVTGYFGSALTGAAPSNTLTYASAANSYIVTDAANAVLTSGTYVPGGTIAFSGVKVSISGTPNAGDKFTLQPNTSGVSDNRNALTLAGLQTKLTLLNGKAGFQDVYNQLVTDIGVKTSQAKTNSDAQTVLLNQAKEAQQSTSGVNLDEEAATMVRYQQAYQAAAQIITTSKTMFDTLLTALRG